MNLSETISSRYGQFLRYGLAGVASVVTHISVLFVLVEFLGTNETIASAIGFLCAIPVNYGIQHQYVFSRSGQHRHYFSRYLAVTLAAMALNTLLFAIGLNILEWHYLVTQIGVIVLIFILNFFVNRTFTFNSDNAPVLENGDIA